METKQENSAGVSEIDQLEWVRSRGIDPTTVVPPDREARLRKLHDVLNDRDVPFPIDADTATTYLYLAESGVPFGIGSLSGESVDLADYVNSQHYDSLTPEDHLSWACLIVDQQAAKQEYACREYLQGERLFDIGDWTIPEYYILNARIYQQTGWQLATVSEIIPAEVFFHCHSHKFFPVTTFMRTLGTDYLEEPDIGHDIAGHVATFTIPQVANVMNNHGLANDMIHKERLQKLETAGSPEERIQIENEARELLLYAGRIYWFTVEFGLVLQDESLKAFGAGILSSPGETKYSIDSPEPNRVMIDLNSDHDLLRLATTDYLICEFQKTYFVMKDFESLDSLTPDRILRAVKAAQNLPHHTWREIVAGDEVINVGTSLASSNEKYFRLFAGQQLDECLTRTARRNLSMFREGINASSELEQSFMNRLVPVPKRLIDASGESPHSFCIEEAQRGDASCLGATSE